MRHLACAVLVLAAAHQISCAGITHVVTLEPVYTLPFALTSSVELKHSLTGTSDIFFRFSTRSIDSGPFPWDFTDAGISYTARPVQSFEQDLLLRYALAFGPQGRLRLSASAELSLKTPPYARILSLQVSTSPLGRTEADLSVTVLKVVSRKLGFSSTASLSAARFREFSSPLPAEISTGFSLDFQSSLMGKHIDRHVGVRLSFHPGLVIPSVTCTWIWNPGNADGSIDS